MLCVEILNRNEKATRQAPIPIMLNTDETYTQTPLASQVCSCARTIEKEGSDNARKRRHDLRVGRSDGDEEVFFVMIGY